MLNFKATTHKQSILTQLSVRHVVVVSVYPNVQTVVVLDLVLSDSSSVCSDKSASHDCNTVSLSFIGDSESLIGKIECGY